MLQDTGAFSHGAAVNQKFLDYIKKRELTEYIS